MYSYVELRQAFTQSFTTWLARGGLWSSWTCTQTTKRVKIPFINRTGKEHVTSLGTTQEAANLLALTCTVCDLKESMNNSALSLWFASAGSKQEWQHLCPCRIIWSIGEILTCQRRLFWINKSHCLMCTIWTKSTQFLLNLQDFAIKPQNNLFNQWTCNNYERKIHLIWKVLLKNNTCMLLNIVL